MRATVRLLFWGLACVRRGVSALQGVWAQARGKNRPERDWLGRLAAAGSITPEGETEIRRLAAHWADSFCGQCGASPMHPQGRCARCWDRLGRILNPPSGDNTITPIDRGPKAP